MTGAESEAPGSTRPLAFKPLAIILAALVATTTLFASEMALAQGAAEGAMDAEAQYVATIRRGPYGEAHISAGNYGSLGYGEAYAAAEDHVCNISYELLAASGSLAEFFGPGDKGSNIGSDAVVRSLNIREQAVTALQQQDAELREWMEGYSAGYNRFIRDHPGERNDSWCSGAPWVRETTAQDFMSRAVLLALTVPRISGAVAAAQPPAMDAEMKTATVSLELASLDGAAISNMGSNGWALGAKYTENGRGVLLANPHYPWYGGNRFWEKHLTIPGEIDVYGAGILGVPGVAIGFNEHVGWTHTVSASQRIVLYRLKLDPENPLRYRHGDEWKDIEEREVSIPVLGEDGKTANKKHTVYFSHHGPLLVMPNMAWDANYAYAVRDANDGNYDIFGQWTAMDKAGSMDEFIDAHRRYNAMPWVNTIAASADGRAVYLDNSTVGNLSEQAQKNWQASLEADRLAAGLYATRRMVLLDGSDPGNDWVDDDRAVRPGTVPFDERPLIEREDYVFNANDSYWLSSPREPMTGYSILYGPTESGRSLRTRMNIRLLENVYGDAGEDELFNIREVQQALFANRGLTFEMLGEELTSLCRAQGASLAEACDVLAAYDGTLELDSPGAVLFREWITRFDPLEMYRAGRLFAVEFDPEQPVATPGTLADKDYAVEALAAAVSVLSEAELPLDATLRDAQFAWRGGKAFPVHGGNRVEGVANLQMSGNPSAFPASGIKTQTVGDSRYLTDAGYPVVHGSSFMVTLGFDERGPVAQGLLSYSQSGNPNSQHFADQTRLYGSKLWRDIAFHEADVKRSTRSTRVLRGR